MSEPQFLSLEKKWCPTSISCLEQHLMSLICENDHFSSEQAQPIRKNLAYSLQYVEFLYRVLTDIPLTSVLWRQNVKSFVVHGASIIEAIFSFLVISKGEAKSTCWKTAGESSSTEFSLDGKNFKHQILTLEKLKTPAPVKMTFDQLAKKVEGKKLLGKKFEIYSKIKPLRQLRNKIHIHDSDHTQDTDWFNFEASEYILAKAVLYAVLTSEIFTGSEHHSSFHYLDS